MVETTIACLGLKEHCLVIVLQALGQMVMDARQIMRRVAAVIAKHNSGLQANEHLYKNHNYSSSGFIAEYSNGVSQQEAGRQLIHV